LAELLIEQFTALRDGDRFWYQNTFEGQQLREIEGTRLSDVIERNTELTSIQDNAFIVPGEAPDQLDRPLPPPPGSDAQRSDRRQPAGPGDAPTEIPLNQPSDAGANQTDRPQQPRPPRPESNQQRGGRQDPSDGGLDTLAVDQVLAEIGRA
jgi:peroxidase